MKLLEVKNLKTYFDTSKGQLKAVDDVSFDLDYGEALGLVGESGCGKTTSALSICRLLPKEGKGLRRRDSPRGAVILRNCPMMKSGVIAGKIFPSSFRGP